MVKQVKGISIINKIYLKMSDLKYVKCLKENNEFYLFIFFPMKPEWRLWGYKLHLW